MFCAQQKNEDVHLQSDKVYDHHGTDEQTLEAESKIKILEDKLMSSYSKL